MSDPTELKAHFRDLVSACGGTKRAAAKLGAQPSHISEAMGPHWDDRWPRIDHVAVLESDCQQPIVTRALADRLGYALVAVDVDKPRRAALEHLGSILKECGEVEVALVRASADGRLSHVERRLLLTQVNEALAVLTSLRVDLLNKDASDVG